MNANSSINHRPKILVVDDVEANLQVVCRRLEGGAYDLHPVESGEKALQFIEDEKPDLVLLDYMMPNINGIDVLNVVRKEWNLAELPIIMLTARAEAEAVVSALEAGADDYVSKPLDFDVLKARIETQLGKVKSHDNLRQANAALDDRVAMRVLAFDQLREELEREIVLRKKAEQQLDSLQMAESGVAEPGAVPSEALNAAIEIVDRIANAAKMGQPINQALLSSLRGKLASMAE